jgi:hypothetical protein
MKVLEENQSPAGENHPEDSGVKPSPKREDFFVYNPPGRSLMSKTFHENTFLPEKPADSIGSDTKSLCLSHSPAPSERPWRPGTNSPDFPQENSTGREKTNWRFGNLNRGPGKIHKS